MRVGQTRIHLEKSPPKKNHSIGGSLQIPLAKGKVKGKDQVIRLDPVPAGWVSRSVGGVSTTPHSIH